MLNTPILFLIYNRPDKTLKVFEAIKKVRPAKLFVVADGPRNEEAGILCQQTRDVLLNIDWDCELKTLYRTENIGVKRSVSSGINWFFEHIDEGIVLEDDCVPNDSFFFFCSAMLEFYKDNESIMHITGTDLIDNGKKHDYTYYFSNYPNIWGWATWKRAWRKYDLELTDKSYYKKLINTRFKDPFERRFWHTVLESLKTLDTWDYQWMFSIWKAGGICINTNYNFVSNIGFDATATHTKYDSPYSGLTTKTINKIVHPATIAIDKETENDFLKTLHNLDRKGYRGYFLMRGKNLIHKIKLLLKKIK
ncbi:nucleotide-diphospho-sugar transferase [Mucilaginibacter sp. UR6-11]|uniref:nucleotide-diphospho-sugar transferase n=1 Tax=Mucilaginibacter sp. UR6-11 TaxID=1435644 RepID=UPI001E499BE1|nr:nucleotide-diphospho-sugar transferase [Mucilaginibacter sp. UR6-11]MCC8425726.1 nucleotide-diphospho-sugar transferase [Mucilaginibacter sp. UR6-11]